MKNTLLIMDISLIQFVAVIVAVLAAAGILAGIIMYMRRGRRVDNAKSGGTRTSEDESLTRRLIGDEAFERMRTRIASLLRRHSADRSTSLWLSGCPGDSTGWEELHALLPGMPVTLENVSHDGISAVAVYSRDVRVGTLLMNEAEKAIQLTDNAQVTGAYVAEQNSYGVCDDMSLKIVLFYNKEEADHQDVPASPHPVASVSPASEADASPCINQTTSSIGPVTPEQSERDAMVFALTSEYKYIHRGDRPLVLIMN